MSGILDAIKNKTEGRFGIPAVELSMSGKSSGHSVSNGNNVSTINTSGTNYVKERAEAAKAQQEARRAMEEERRAMEESRKKSEEAKTAPKTESVEDSKPVQLRAPVKRPPSASINHAAVVAAQKAEMEEGSDSQRPPASE